MSIDHTEALKVDPDARRRHFQWAFETMDAVLRANGGADVDHLAVGREILDDLLLAGEASWIHHRIVVNGHAVRMNGAALLRWVELGRPPEVLRLLGYPVIVRDQPGSAVIRKVRAAPPLVGPAWPLVGAREQ